MLPKTLTICPKSNKSPNLVTLTLTHLEPNVFWNEITSDWKETNFLFLGCLHLGMFSPASTTTTTATQMTLKIVSQIWRCSQKLPIWVLTDVHILSLFLSFSFFISFSLSLSFFLYFFLSFSLSLCFYLSLSLSFFLSLSLYSVFRSLSFSFARSNTNSFTHILPRPLLTLSLFRVKEKLSFLPYHTCPLFLSLLYMVLNLPRYDLSNVTCYFLLIFAITFLFLQCHCSWSFRKMFCIPHSCYRKCSYLRPIANLINILRS